MTRKLRLIPLVAILLLGSLVVGTTWHEVVGHGLTGVLLGGRLRYVQVLTVRFSPGIEWRGWEGAYGVCDVTDVPTPRRERIMELAGSMSTWCVSVLAVGLLWIRRWRGWRRWLLIGLSIWWIDLMTYLLPSWGIRRSILWGARSSEPYQAATALGIPGPLIQSFGIVTSVALAAALVLRLVRDRDTKDAPTDVAPAPQGS